MTIGEAFERFLAAEAVPGAGSEWKTGEIESLVEDYLDMLRAALDGASDRQADHWRALPSHLPGRTKGSIEKRHQNVSAVLVERRLRFINGYKPLANYQRALAEEVDRRLATDERPSSCWSTSAGLSASGRKHAAGW